jgi:hypothetical protein
LPSLDGEILHHAFQISVFHPKVKLFGKLGWTCAWVSYIFQGWLQEASRPVLDNSLTWGPQPCQGTAKPGAGEWDLNPWG